MFTQTLQPTQTIVKPISSSAGNALIANILLGFTQKTTAEITEYLLDESNSLFVTMLNRIPDIAQFISNVIPSSLEAEYLVHKLNDAQDNIREIFSDAEYLTSHFTYIGSNEYDDPTELSDYAEDLIEFANTSIYDFQYV